MSTIYLRRAKLADLNTISEIIEEARKALKEAGNPQWKDGVANFSWFIGVFLSGAAYRWIARDDRAPAASRFTSRPLAQKE